MRNAFANEIYELMKKNQDVYLLLGDLGFGYFDEILEDFKERAFSLGASETAMMGVAVGLAQEGKIPFVYSITNFLIYRPFEVIRNYIDYEKAKVILVGSGRDKDYECDGISHWSEDVKGVLNNFKQIKKYFPKKKEEINKIIKQMVKDTGPSFISLKR